MDRPNYREALDGVVAAFDAMGVSYLVAGSVASMAYGVMRTTLDVDVVADLRQEHVRPLAAALADAYYADAQMIADAVRERASFNVIHLETMFKVDVFVLKRDAYDQQAFARAVRRHQSLPALTEGGARPVLPPGPHIGLRQCLRDTASNLHHGTSMPRRRESTSSQSGFRLVRVSHHARAIHAALQNASRNGQRSVVMQAFPNVRIAHRDEWSAVQRCEHDDQERRDGPDRHARLPHAEHRPPRRLRWENHHVEDE